MIRFMALATALAIGSVVASVAGTGLSVYGQRQATKARESAASANAAQLELTAQGREAEAHESLTRAAREARRELAGMRATMAGSGTQLNDGSNLDVLGAATTRLETKIRDQARATMLETRSLRQSAALETYQGEIAGASGGLSMAGTLMGGFSRTAKNVYDFKQAGNF